MYFHVLIGGYILRALPSPNAHWECTPSFLQLPEPALPKKRIRLRRLSSLRAGQYWRLENLKSFDEFLARRFPESRRKVYYLMSIHEHLPPQARKDLKVGC